MTMPAHIRHQRVFRLVINSLDNEAFSDGNEAFEIARILRVCATRIENGEYGFPSETIRDVNGNDVGRYAVKTLEQWG